MLRGRDAHALARSPSPVAAPQRAGSAPVSRGKGRGKGKAPSVNSTKVYECLPDYVDVEMLRFIGSRKGSRMVDIHLMRSQPTDLPPESARQMAYTFLKRQEAGTISVHYKQEHPAAVTGVPGRVCAGLSKEDVPSDHPLMDSVDFSRQVSLRGVWRSTRGPFSLGRALKELVRGGQENLGLRDYDVSVSFSRAVHARHSDLNAVGRWIHENAAFVEECGVSRDACKALVNAGAGIGDAGIRKWREQQKLEAVPPLLLAYVKDLRVAKRRDVEINTELVGKLRAAGYSLQRDIDNLVTYLLNGQWEAKTLREFVDALRGLAYVCANEKDGLVLALEEDVEWAQVEAIARDFPHFVWKPYRRVAELLDRLGFADTTLGPWSIVEADWEVRMGQLDNLHKRLHAGELPALLAASEVPFVLCRDGQSLTDLYKAGPGKCAGMCFYTFRTRPKGGMWERLNGDKVLPVEMDLVKSLCAVMGIEGDEATAAFLAGHFTSNILTRLGDALFDPALLGQLDGDASYGHIAFSCGLALELSTRQVSPATKDLYITRHVGYPYPEKELLEVDRQQAAAGLDLVQLLRRVRDWEAMPLNDGAPTYPAALVADLNRFAELPAFELVDMLHNSFTTSCPDGERAGGWQVTIFRTGKVLAAAIAKKAKNFVVDFGEDGGNGKGLLWNCIKQTFGHLAADIGISLLTSPPPGPSKPSPEMFDLRGLRFTCCSEFEKTSVVKAMWLKLFGDTSTEYTGRGLWMDNVKFKIPAVCAISSNVKLAISSTDGGIMRRNLGCNWPVAFRSNPQGVTERPLHGEDLENNAFYTPLRVAAFLHWVLACYQVFFCEDGATGLKYRPPAIRLATSKNISNEFEAFVAEFLEERCEAGTWADAMTHRSFQAAFFLFMDESENDRPGPEALDAALAVHAVFKALTGSTKKLQHIMTRTWMRLRVA